MPPLPPIFDVLIIGGGPAGLNAALTCARTRTTALVLDSRAYRNARVTHMHTVASRDHFDPAEFRRISREQIESRYDTVFFRESVVTHAARKTLAGAGNDGASEGFEVRDEAGAAFQGRKIVLATGTRDLLPDIPGYADNWSSHIYQCLACDGFEQRGSAVGILEFASPMSTHLVQMAAAFDPASLTIFSNGPVTQDAGIQDAVRLAKAFGATLDERRVVRMVNNGPTHKEGITLVFETGEPATLGFLVHRPATVNRGQHLVEQLGVETVEQAAGGHIKIVNPMFNETSVRGVFAAGDTMVVMKQVAIAMAEGLKAAAGAGMQIGQEVAERKGKELEKK
ncbi:FAD/NAD(P)-binding domain-containing protein [Pyrenochaeta sp. DS3sAY3a]|nr:FAD/NAD(P)-binding domain-containing protein [Pyrenochaeta sp. DS3sAY3a]